MLSEEYIIKDLENVILHLQGGFMRILQTIKKGIICAIMLMQGIDAQWMMFSDGTDTYLYNTQNGDVYVRYKKGGKNYEDMFVKMPAGVLQTRNLQTQNTKNSLDSSLQSTNQNLEAIRKSQELLRQSIDSASLIE